MALACPSITSWARWRANAASARFASCSRGTGADGSAGLKAVKQNGGLVIAQDPEEAAYDGMPRSAIMTGAVDLVLPLAKIPEVLLKHRQYVAPNATHKSAAAPPDQDRESLAKVIDLLDAETSHKFGFYKPGTLMRRIERRMALTATKDSDRYLELLRKDQHERESLAKDLLIHVTSFFRDPRAFEVLAESVIPDLVRRQSSDQSIRVWVPACSTGEEPTQSRCCSSRRLPRQNGTSSCRSSPRTSTPTP
jgi:two-component system CheB/CheR fusion protein